MSDSKWWADLERRIMEAEMRYYTNAQFYNDVNTISLDEDECIDLVKGHDGVWRASLEEGSFDPAWKTMHVDPTYHTVHIVDECADVDPDVYKLGPRQAAAVDPTVEWSQSEGNLLAAGESVRAAAERVPYWSNRHDLLFSQGILKPTKPVVGS